MQQNSSSCKILRQSINLKLINSEINDKNHGLTQNFGLTSYININTVLVKLSNDANNLNIVLLITC